jgi:hypothetical protein
MIRSVVVSMFYPFCIVRLANWRVTRSNRGPYAVPPHRQTMVMAKGSLAVRPAARRYSRTVDWRVGAVLIFAGVVFPCFSP